MPRWAPFEPYFWGLVDKSSDCWIWKGDRSGSGYGRVWHNGKRQPAHRVACALAGVPIPDHLLGCHKCDNKLCVRPSHIFAGTQVDNMQDWTKKGNNKLTENPIRGEAHWTKRDEGRKKISNRRRSEFASGKREIIRDPASGKITGTKMT